ncbi:MAG: outer membrane protein assembly factor BamD [Rhodospirillales bacterium]|nr:outer membrane protein assembly factor BamD [Rhodospirillales bacterium]MCB9979579.1 outer membrane protein assembly factor BamD [Rhodospirillales bacterium]
MNLYMRVPFLFLCLTTVLALGACASDKALDPTQATAEEIYAKAAKSLEDGNNSEAAQLFEEVERQYPYSSLATQAQLKAAYALYDDEKYDEAILSLDRFIELHPGNKEIDYAYYLKALCYYEQIADVSRDQSLTKDALDALNALINRYPQSQYARDAMLKRDLTLDHLAGKEMEIGRYYLQQNQINAAINRFLIVVRNFQTTTHTPEALHRLVECYMTLGLKDEAYKVAAVLGHNYPGSEWYAATYKLLDPAQRDKLLENRSLLDRTINSLLTP